MSLPDKTCAVAPPANTETGKVTVSEFDWRKEVDYRVAMRIAERDYVRSEYKRGVNDALYICLIVACFAVGIYFQFYGKEL